MKKNHFSSLFLSIYIETMFIITQSTKNLKSVLEFIPTVHFHDFLQSFWQKIAITQ
jgi:hypothetical protein